MLRLLLCLTVLSAGVAVIPDSSIPSKSWRLAYVYKGDIWTADGDGSNRRLLVEDGSSPCWSPDKKRVAFAREGDIWVVGVADRVEKRLTINWGPAKAGENESEGRATDIAWDSKSGNLYFSHWENFLIRRPGDKNYKSVPTCTIFELSPKGGVPIPRLDLMEDEARFRTSKNGHPTFSRSGHLMAFARNGDVWLADRLNDSSYLAHDSAGRRWEGWDMRRLSAAAQYDAPNYRGSRWNEFATHLSISPDEKLLAYGIARINGTGSRGLVLLHIKLERGNYRVEKEDDRGDGLDPCFSPDGKWIAYVGHEPDAGVYAMQVTGTTRRLLIPDGLEPAW